jgi:hypothetical protein
MVLIPIGRESRRRGEVCMLELLCIGVFLFLSIASIWLVGVLDRLKGDDL